MDCILQIKTNKMVLFFSLMKINQDKCKKKILMCLLTQQNGPVRHAVSLYSERGSGIYTLHPYLKNDSYFIMLKKSRNISLWRGAFGARFECVMLND